MRAVWLEELKLSVREDVPLPELPAGEALIRLRLAGICSTDLELVKGYYPYRGVLGHEFVGEVVQSPDDPAWVGKRVVGEINAVCGECEPCRTGSPTHCANRTVLGIANRDGVFAEYLRLPAANLWEVPTGVPDEAAVFTEPLAAALEIQQQVQIKPTDRVLVVGAGRLGQLIAQTLALTGCELRVAARRPRAIALLRSRHIQAVDPVDIPERALDIVIEATGSPEGFALARRAVKPRGTLVLKSTYAGDLQVNFSSLVVDEITLVGSRCGSFAPALRLLARGEVNPLPLIEQRFPLSRGLEAFALAAQPGVLKVLLQSGEA